MQHAVKETLYDLKNPNIAARDYSRKPSIEILCFACNGDRLAYRGRRCGAVLRFTSDKDVEVVECKSRTGRLPASKSSCVTGISAIVKLTPNATQVAHAMVMIDTKGKNM